MDFSGWTDDDLEIEIQLGSGGPARKLYLAEQKRRETQAHINKQLREMESEGD